MSIKKTVIKSLEDTKNLLLQFNDTMYQTKLPIISNETIGRHFRHVIEFYVCLFSDDQYICYDERKRNFVWENSIIDSISIIDLLIDRINIINLDKSILLKQSYYDEKFYVPSTYQRELIYCFDHSIHHFALIRIAIENNFPCINYSKNFGIAPSTIAYQKIADESNI